MIDAARAIEIAPGRAQESGPGYGEPIDVVQRLRRARPQMWGALLLAARGEDEVRGRFELAARGMGDRDVGCAPLTAAASDRSFVVKPRCSPSPERNVMM
jgi:hypothetical protein